ncbi:MAG TPA: DUF559 domain-containing protein [Longimicrobium sp.]
MRKEDRNRWDVSPALKARMTEVARGFRKAPTPSEAILWRALRGEALGGHKFRRQQPIGPFIVDFYCSTERLIVEVDGGVHETQRERDAERQALLESLDLRFVRLPADLVEINLPAALQAIRRAFTSSSPLPHPAPLVGEGPGEGGTEAA